MDMTILVGTLEEVRRELGRLPVPPQTRVRLAVEDSCSSPRDPRTRNGFAILPVKIPGVVVTTNMVSELNDLE